MKWVYCPVWEFIYSLQYRFTVKGTSWRKVDWVKDERREPNMVEQILFLPKEDIWKYDYKNIPQNERNWVLIYLWTTFLDERSSLLVLRVQGKKY